jgi:hypothetical protein
MYTKIVIGSSVMSGDVIVNAIYQCTQKKIRELSAQHPVAMSDVTPRVFLQIIAASINNQELSTSRRTHINALMTAYKDVVSNEVQLYRDLMQQTENWATASARGWSLVDTEMLKETMKQLWAKVLTKEMSPEEIQPRIEQRLKDKGWLNPSFTANAFCRDVVEDVLNKKFNPEFDETSIYSERR